MGLFDQKKEEKEEAAVYCQEIECANCGDSSEYEIPYRMTVKEYLRRNKEICEVCGCPVYEEDKNDN